MKTSGVIATLLALANVSLSAHIGDRRRDIRKRQEGLDIFGSAAQAFGSLRSMSKPKIFSPSTSLTEA
jgi:hypothetical protein